MNGLEQSVDVAGARFDCGRVDNVDGDDSVVIVGRSKSQAG